MMSHNIKRVRRASLEQHLRRLDTLILQLVSHNTIVTSVLPVHLVYFSSKHNSAYTSNLQQQVMSSAAAARGMAACEDELREASGSLQGTSTAAMELRTDTNGGLQLTYTQLRLNKKNFINWTLKTQILLEIQGI
jgi:hypothetical protein